MTSRTDLSRNLLNAAWVDADFDTVRNAVTPEFTYRLSSSPDSHDINWYVAFLTAVHGAFENLSIYFHEFVAEGDTVAVHYTFVGKHTGTVFGVEPKGNQGHLEVMSFLRFRDDKVDSQAAIVDFHSLRNQMLA